MTLISLKGLVALAAALQFCQVPAMLVAPRMLGWQSELSKLTPINRQIVRVMGGGIMLTVLGLAVVVLLSPEELINGHRLGTGLAGFLACFWAYRGAVQIFLYSRVWPQDTLLGKASHLGLSLLFTFQTTIYAVAFVVGAIK